MIDLALPADKRRAVIFHFKGVAGHESAPNLRQALRQMGFLHWRWTPLAIM
jgi:hypothetical protein